MRTFGIGFVRGDVQDPYTIAWSAPAIVETFGELAANFYTPAIMTMDVDPLRGSIDLLYHPTLPDDFVGGLWVRQSFDEGARWSDPEPLASDSTALTNGVSLLRTAQGDAFYFWQEAQSQGRRILCQRSDGGTLDPAEIIDTRSVDFLAGPGRVGFIGESWGAAIDPSGTGLFSGRIAFMAGNDIDRSRDEFPDPATACSVPELEPNGTAANATMLSVGCIARGHLDAGDVDYYAVDLIAEKAIDVHVDSTSSTLDRALIEVIGPDGTTSLVGGWPALGFAPPVSGRFHIVVRAINSYTGDYRIRTVDAGAPKTGARDQRDLFVATHPYSGTWTPAARMDPQPALTGYEECGPALAWNQDGCFYASWYQFDPAPAQAVSRRVASRSSDGGVTWSLPVTISGVNSDWSVPATSIKMGSRTEMIANGPDLYAAWADNRNGDADVYVERIRRQITLANSDVVALSGAPGSSVGASRLVNNLDEFFPFDIRMEVHDDRRWPLQPGYGTVPRGRAGFRMGYVIAIPDTAAPGVNRITVTYCSGFSPFTPYVPAPYVLTITPPAAVADPQPVAFDLTPVTPNPARGAAQFGYALPTAAPARVVVYGVDGRVIRSLADGRGEPGVHRLAWDGRDASGRPSPSGTYFVRLESAGSVRTRRFVWMR
jgi:hypothetical protein